MLTARGKDWPSLYSRHMPRALPSYGKRAAMPNEPASLDILGVASATGGFNGLDRFSGIVFLGNALDKFLVLQYYI